MGAPPRKPGLSFFPAGCEPGHARRATGDSQARARSAHPAGGVPHSRVHVDGDRLWHRAFMRGRTAAGSLRAPAERSIGTQMLPVLWKWSLGALASAAILLGRKRRALDI